MFVLGSQTVNCSMKDKQQTHETQNKTFVSFPGKGNTEFTYIIFSTVIKTLNLKIVCLFTYALCLSIPATLSKTR